MDRIEAIILRSLMFDEGYTRRVLPFIDSKYFADKTPLGDTENLIFQKIKKFVAEYNTLPTKEALIIEVEHTRGELPEHFTDYLNELEAEKDNNVNVEWLVGQTEDWCKEQAVNNAVREVVLILNDPSKKRQKGNIPKLLQDALAVSFDAHVGHDYIEDADMRWDFYHKVESRIKFHLDDFNRITKNGVPRKTLNMCLAGTGVGKSLFMCDLAANYLQQNKNVLYITLEMAEERIAERIDANLMDVPLDELAFMSKEAYDKRIARVREKTDGKLIIKEYPTASANADHFRHLLNELLLKKKFIPDVIFIDYLNICISTRIKTGNAGMYELVKSIAEELRGLAVEMNVPIWSATQMNRAGFNNNDPDLTNTSESFGLPATADFMFALIAEPNLIMMNQLLVKILKNRYGDLHMRNKDTGTVLDRFVVGIDRSKMKLYNLDSSAQNDLSDMNGGTPSARPKAPRGQGPGKAVQPGTIEGPDDTPPWEATDPIFDIDSNTEEKLQISAEHGSTGYKSGYLPNGKPKKQLKVE